MSEYSNHNPEMAKEVEPNPEEIETLIVLGKNRGNARSELKKNNRTKDVLSLESKMNALAAGWIYLQSKGRMQKIVFSGGKTSGPEWNSEARSMAHYLKTNYPDIPETAFVLEEAAVDTKDNAERIKSILETSHQKPPAAKLV